MCMELLNDVIIQCEECDCEECGNNINTEFLVMNIQ